MTSISFDEMSQRRTSGDSAWSFDVEEFDDVVAISQISKDVYPAKKHARSVLKHLDASSGLIYVPGTSSEIYADSDEAVHFRQARYFYYLSGLELPDCTVTYDIAHEKLCAWIPPMSTGRSVIYNGSSPSREEIKAKYDFDEVDYSDKLDAYIKNYIQAECKPTVFLLRKEKHIGSSRLFDLAQHVVHEMKKIVRFDIHRLMPAMDAARVIKSSYELRMIRKACAITGKAHVNVLRNLKTLKNESEIEAIFTATCIAHQAKNQAYGVIAGSGANASTLHYAENSEPLEGRQLVVLDAGCEWKCYASDVTRTFPISGKFTPEAMAIYYLVDKMQQECIEMVKPDADYRFINMKAHQIATEGLMQLGILYNGTLEEIFLAKASTAFLPHGLGHYLGLETHDVGDGGLLLFNKKTVTSSKFGSITCEDMSHVPIRNASILRPNQVITVEPGIYFNRYALEEVWLKDPRIAKYINKEILETYYPVGGVRIEDDILVTEDGYENITGGIPKGEEALRIINEGLKELVVVEKVDVGGDKRRRWFW